MVKTPLCAVIEERLRSSPHHAINIAEYMNLCLAHPQHGYYMTRDPFGLAGDFTTAPEISQMFGEIIGAWVVDIWHKMGSPADFILLECGPGRGTLMADMLRVAAKASGFLSSARIILQEISPVLKAKQGETLGSGITWIAGLDEIPPALPLIIIANEFLDALPVHQVIRRAANWHERVISLTPEGLLCFTEQEMPQDLRPFAPPDAPDNLIVEISPARLHYLGHCAVLIRARGGAGLWIDYGAAHTGHGDTLQAARAHSFADPLAAPGLADLTTHVDFEVLRAAALSAGVSCPRVVTQGAFLTSLGIAHRAAKLDRADDMHRLVAPDQMGHLFKVLCCHHGLSAPPEGF